MELLRAYDDCFFADHRLADINAAIELLRGRKVSGVRLTPRHLDSYNAMERFLVERFKSIAYVHPSAASGMEFIALTNPQNLGFIQNHVEAIEKLIVDRELTDAEELMSLVEDMKQGSIHLNEGML
jgi:hypothetical protein